LKQQSANDPAIAVARSRSEVEATGPAGDRGMARPAASSSPRRILVVGIPVAILAGLTLPVQARINGELSIRLGDGMFAGLISFVASLLIMGAAMLCTAAGRTAFRSLVAGTRERAIPWYYHAAGAGGAYFVLGMTYFSVAVGLAVYTVAVVTGQTLGGLVVDRLGLGPGGKRRITLVRVFGVMLTVVAVFYAVSPRISGTHEPLTLLLPVTLVILAGFLVSFQHAVNGTLAVHVRSPLPGTLVNYAVGATFLVLAWLIKFSVDYRMPSLPAEPWLYLAGVLGCLNLLMSAVLLRHIGILLTWLSMIAGQLIGSLLLDWVLPVPGSVIYLETLLGTGLTLVAIVIAALPGSGSRRVRVRRA
jgi:transporter family-2 protein